MDPGFMRRLQNGGSAVKRGVKKQEEVIFALAIPKFNDIWGLMLKMLQRPGFFFTC